MKHALGWLVAAAALACDGGKQTSTPPSSDADATPTPTPTPTPTATRIADSDADADSDTDTDTAQPWQLRACPTSPPNDAITVQDLATDLRPDGDSLVVDFTYGCGCRPAHHRRSAGPAFGGSSSTDARRVFVMHEANGESCDAACSDTLRA
ncbi:MAG: hypothetical protein R3F59_36565 [Myxococcota bacterium]